MLQESYYVRLFILLFLSIIPFTSFSLQASKCQLTDNQIKETLMHQSIKNYTGPCACPDQRDRAGKLCGECSAYLKPGGYRPLCFHKDVTPKMIQEFRVELGYQ